MEATAPISVVTTGTFRYPHPAPYDGVRDGFSILNFLQRMRLFFMGAQIEAERQTVVALAFAGDEAVSWWTLLALPNNTPFNHFSSLLATEFSPSKFKEHILSLAMKMKMSTPANFANVTAYITLARKYHLLLQSYYSDNHAMLTDTIRTAFLAGAPQQLRQMLEVVIANAGDNTVEMPQLFKSAEEFGRIFNSDDMSTGAKALAISGSTNDPNAMEIDNIQVKLNNINRQLSNMHRSLNNRNNNNNYHNNNRNNNNNNGHPAPLTQNERDHLMRTGGCLRCRQQGHYGRDCPRYGNGNNSGRRINQVIVGNPDESGNASDDQA
jgi:hypothetical protein